MMSLPSFSLLLVVFGQFLNAATVLIDKYIVTDTAVSKPGVYAFYVSAISGVVLLLLPFGIVHLPDSYTLVLSGVIGLCYIGSLYFLYSALKIADATDVVPWLGAVSTIATFLLSFIFLSGQLPQNFLFALGFFIVGMLLVGHFRFQKKSFLYVLGAGVLFGFSSVLLKLLFGHVSFVDGFFWSRMGNVLAALLLLIPAENRNAIFNNTKSASVGTKSLIVFNRILGGLSFLSILYAIRYGSVSIINALASLQFIFVFLFTLLLMKRMPEMFAHAFRKGHVAHKVAATLFIMAGFFVLFL